MQAPDGFSLGELNLTCSNNLSCLSAPWGQPLFSSACASAAAASVFAHTHAHPRRSPSYLSSSSASAETMQLCTYTAGSGKRLTLDPISLSPSLLTARRGRVYNARGSGRYCVLHTYVCLSVGTHSGSTSANITINYLNSEVYVRNRQGRYHTAPPSHSVGRGTAWKQVQRGVWGG